ncbi:MAG: altronate dehydratase [Clostridia bacterium]|nr:altronate dehydratase [Clostridia bacterium]
MDALLRITGSDNVAVALRPLVKGESLDLDSIHLLLQTDVPAGHKVALEDIPKDGHVIKYGFPIGYAKEDIPKGSHIHVHNLHTLLSGELTYTYQPTHPEVRKQTSRTFMGFPRKNGQVGIRNELWIVPTVGCVNDIARALEKEAQSLLVEGVERVYAFTHPYGCSQMTEDQENTRQILADLATHPNAGGVLLLGLGCENSGIEQIKAHMDWYDPERMRFLICQQVEDEMEAGMQYLRELSDFMRKDRREPCDVSKLVVGLKCGGSDGFSGITANPTIGGFSDRLVAQGGTTILTEVPEMFGAETILMNRCKDEATFEKTVRLINDFKHYFESYHQTIYENPSPGNKAGGISTLEDKALGCTQKSGFSPVNDVLEYGEKVKTPGLNLLSAPGNDLVAATALASSGAHLVLFSTGRGTPFACPVPTLKISSNSALAAKKYQWIDFNAGRLLDEKQPMTLDQLSDELFDLVIEVASGKTVHSEDHGFHDLAIFKTGVTL